MGWMDGLGLNADVSSKGGAPPIDEAPWIEDLFISAKELKRTGSVWFIAGYSL